MQTPVTTAAARDTATDTYTPQRERAGIGVCLSGGGYRAALFHLGALRRLNEVGILHQTRTITSVSGGSIIAALLAMRIPWPLNAPLPDFEATIARPLRAFTATNIRTWPVLKRWLPWNWARTSTGVETLATTYERRLTNARLDRLPATPNFILCATDMAFADNWTFERDRMGAYKEFADITIRTDRLAPEIGALHPELQRLIGKIVGEECECPPAPIE